MSDDPAAVLGHFTLQAPFMMGVVELLDQDIQFVMANTATARLFGLPGPITAHHSLRRLGVAPAALQLWLDECRKALLAQTPARFVCAFEKGPAAPWLSITLTPLAPAASRPPRLGFLAETIDGQVHGEAQSALRDSQTPYEVLVNAIDGIVWEADALTFQFTFVSRQAERLLGYPLEHWTDEPSFWENHLYPDDRHRAVAYCAAAVAEGRSHEFEYRMVAADGRIVWLRDIVNVAMVDNQPAKLRGVMIDVTRHRLTEAAWNRSASEMRALFNAMSDVILVLDADGRYLRIAPTNPALLYRPEPGLIGKTLHDVFPPGPADNFLGHIRQALRSGQTVDFEYRLPIGGVDVWFSATVSPMLGEQVLWVARDITERKVKEQEQATVLTVTSALRRALTRDEMPALILDQIMSLLQVSAAALALHDPDQRQGVIELARGPWGQASGMRLAPGEGMIGRVIQTGHPLVNNAAGAEPASGQHDLFAGFQAAACVPLIAQDQPIGALWVACDRSIDPAEARLLSLVANVAASALYRAALHEQTERRLQRLQALRAIDVAISSGIELPDTLTVVLNQVVGQLGVHAAAISIIHRQSGRLDYAAWRGFAAVPSHETPLWPAGRVVLERRMIHLPHLTAMGEGQRFAGEGFVAYYGLPLTANGQVLGALEVFHHTSLHPDGEWLNFLETLAGQAAIAVENANLFRDLFESNTRLAQAYDATIEGWSRALDMRDRETVGHTERVTELTLRLARRMGIDEEALVHLYRGALLHDIGKMGVPDNILLKPGPLSDDEKAVMRQHPANAYEMLAPIDYLRPALAIPFCHHEKWDGTGYPQGLKGEDIPLAARIFAVADVWDALRSDRPYRVRWPAGRVREYLRAEAGKHFDPGVVEAFLSLVNDDAPTPA